MENEQAQFPNLEKGRGQKSIKDLDFLLDIPLEISVSGLVGERQVKDFPLNGPRSLYGMTKLAGEPLEILINQKLIARGEAVVVNEKFGVRITDIVSPMERVKQLG
jgi:flagellar motor switch protein FliN/FliY